jgi:hypothetical protein
VLVVYAKRPSVDAHVRLHPEVPVAVFPDVRVTEQRTLRGGRPVLTQQASTRSSLSCGVSTLSKACPNGPPNRALGLPNCGTIYVIAPKTLLWTSGGGFPGAGVPALQRPCECAGRIRFCRALLLPRRYMVRNTFLG